MEIERKFEVKRFPDNLNTYPVKRIEQGYLCSNPIIRIRKSNEDYYLTYKSKTGLEKGKGSAIIRNEVELPLTVEAYQTLRKKTEGNIVYKSRYLIGLTDGLTAELDVFEGHLSGLYFVEVEFPDEKTADDFTPPEWFGKDISEDSRFSNHYLSQISSLQELGL